MRLASLVRLRWLVGVLLIAGAALFAVGASAERHNDLHHEAAAAATTREGTVAAEGSKAAEVAEAAAADITDVGSEPANEKVLGISLESTLLVVVAVIVSLVLAVATWRSNTKLIVLMTAGFAAVFAALDIAELVHQIDRSAPGLTLLAAIIAAMHAGAAVVAAQRGTASAA